ncbi:hypothetical protein D917_05263 [Trichinella nativa]|uniref:Uncharacterized protein n=1 Tax=Trichinella nativa TaxID=6335 RepID=A0A1Y3EWR7_9BILA|nr:hypothetical protein D917_05263 [Trichinella nativa]
MKFQLFDCFCSIFFSLTVFELLNELTIIFYCVKENVQKPQI